MRLDERAKPSKHTPRIQSIPQCWLPVVVGWCSAVQKRSIVEKERKKGKEVVEERGEGTLFLLIYYRILYRHTHTRTFALHHLYSIHNWKESRLLRFIDLSSAGKREKAHHHLSLLRCRILGYRAGTLRGLSTYSIQTHYECVLAYTTRG